jgi:hypothetical protein
MKIFGQVLDTEDLPMALANIVIVTGQNATKMGVQSDLDGNFILEDSSISPESQFKISYVGYSPQYYRASELQGRKVKLLEAIEDLDELVIFSGSKPTDTKTPSSTKKKFIQHLQDHKICIRRVRWFSGININC